MKLPHVSDAVTYEVIEPACRHMLPYRPGTTIRASTRVNNEVVAVQFTADPRMTPEHGTAVARRAMEDLAYEVGRKVVFA